MSACGKFILGGEHSVVSRGRALAFPIAQWRLSAELHTDRRGLWSNGTELEEAHWLKVQEVLQLYGASHVSSVSVTSDIPISKGLGSSAALCVELARQCTQASGDALAKLAREGESIFHGVSSGVDPYTITLEQPIVFHSTNCQHRALDLSIFRRARLRFVLRDSGQTHSTAAVIAAVTKTKTNNPLIWQDLMDALATNAEGMLKAFEHEPRQLGRLMNDSHFRLLQLGVSTDTLDDLAEDSRNRGALGAKLTGAGCGGYIIALFPEEQALQLGEEFTVLPTI